MSEKLKLNQETSESIEKEKLIDRLNDSNDARMLCEADSNYVSKCLKEIIYSKRESDRTDDDSAKINKYKAYFKLNELTLARLEREMTDAEYQLDFDTSESSRFDNEKNDTLVNSSIFYHDRIDDLRKASGNDDVDKYFVKSIKEYVYAVECASSMSEDGSSYDLSSWQDKKVDYDKYRSKCHNQMINEFNALNDKCHELNIDQLMYRNLITNSSVNGYKNNKQMYHDRLTLVNYLDEIIHQGIDFKQFDHMPS